MLKPSTSNHLQHHNNLKPSKIQ